MNTDHRPDLDTEPVEDEHTPIPYLLTDPPIRWVAFDDIKQAALEGTYRP